MADDPKKIICPECETENDAANKKCSKCSLSLDDFNAFDRLMSARDKKRKREADAAEAKRKAAELEQDKSLFSWLRGK